eukprot:30524-Pelagococcus_subviridis.AAC.5
MRQTQRAQLGLVGSSSPAPAPFFFFVVFVVFSFVLPPERVPQERARVGLQQTEAPLKRRRANHLSSRAAPPANRSSNRVRGGARDAMARVQRHRAQAARQRRDRVRDRGVGRERRAGEIKPGRARRQPRQRAKRRLEPRPRVRIAHDVAIGRARVVRAPSRERGADSDRERCGGDERAHPAGRHREHRELGRVQMRQDALEDVAEVLQRRTTMMRGFRLDIVVVVAFVERRFLPESRRRRRGVARVFRRVFER